MYNYVNACYEGSKQITVRTEDLLVNVVAVVYWNVTQTQTNLQSSASGLFKYVWSFSEKHAPRCVT